MKVHGRPVQMLPKPGRSGNRFTRIFIRENWSKMQILPILTQLWPALAGKPVDQFQPLRWPRTGLEGLFKDQLWAQDPKHKRANCGRSKNLRQLIASWFCSFTWSNTFTWSITLTWPKLTRSTPNDIPGGFLRKKRSFFQKPPSIRKIWILYVPNTHF